MQRTTLAPADVSTSDAAEQEGSSETLAAAFSSAAFSRLIKQCFTDSFQTS